MLILFAFACAEFALWLRRRDPQAGLPRTLRRAHCSRGGSIGSDRNGFGRSSLNTTVSAVPAVCGLGFWS